MRSRRSARALLVPVALLLGGVALGACGDDPPSRTAFVQQMQRITNPKVSESLASCIYDKISDDPVVLDAAMQPADVALPTDVSKKLSARTEECLRAETPDSTTTTTSAD